MEITCPTCRGKGIVKCDRCHGTGIISTFPVTVRCMTCDHGDKRCANCGGTGKIKK